MNLYVMNFIIMISSVFTHELHTAQAEKPFSHHQILKLDRAMIKILQLKANQQCHSNFYATPVPPKQVSSEPTTHQSIPVETRTTQIFIDTKSPIQNKQPFSPTKDYLGWHIPSNPEEWDDTDFPIQS